MSHEGGLSESLQRIVAAEDGKAIIAEFKGIILGSYGKRSADGRRFVKNQALRDEFESSEAYSVLFMEFVTDTDAAIEFVNGIIPAGMGDEPAVTALAVAPSPEPTVITKAEIDEMTPEDFMALGARIAAGEVKLAGE